MIDVQVKFETGTIMGRTILLSGIRLRGWGTKNLNEDSNLVENRIRYFRNRSGRPYRTVSCLVCLSDDSGNM